MNNKQLFEDELPKFMDKIKIHLSNIEEVDRMLKERHFLRKKLGYEIGKVYNEIIQNREEK